MTREWRLLDLTPDLLGGEKNQRLKSLVSGQYLINHAYIIDPPINP